MKKTILLLMMVLGLVGQGWGQRRGATIERQRLFRNPNPKSEDSSGGKLEPTLFWSQYDASRRSSMLYVDKNQRMRVLSENPPDAAVQSIMEITAKLKGIEAIDAEAVFKTQRSIAELGKRTAAVNMMRDALYRLNEMYYATAYEKQDTFDKLLQADNTKIQALNTNSIGGVSVLEPTMSESQLTHLFEKVLESATKIAVEEAKSDALRSNAESEAAIEKSKSDAKKYEALLALIEKSDGKMSKEEVSKLVERIFQ